MTVGSWRVLLIATVLTAGLFGCSGGEADTLSTGDWTADDGEVGDTSGGVLQVTTDGCLYLGDQVGKIDIIWPADYTSETADDGSVSVLDPDGRVVAETGKPFAAKGLVLTNEMFRSLGIDDDRVCRATTSDVTLVINSELPPMAHWYTASSHVVTLYHCGVNPTEFENRIWAVRSSQTPFDATTAPDSFVGRGTMVKIGNDEALYTDESSIVLTFVPAESVRGQFCA